MRKSHFPLFFLIVMLVLSVFQVFVPNVSAAPEWTTPDAVHSKCGEDATHPASYAIDESENSYWKHNAACYHWIIFDMGETKKITKIRISTSLSVYFFGKAVGFSVYVSDDPENFGDPVWEGVLTTQWAWNECGDFNKNGRYIKLVDKDNTASCQFREFDAYAEAVAGGENYFVDLTKTFSATFSMLHQTNYQIPLTFTPSTTFTLGTACNFIVNFAFQPSVSFTLNIFYKAFEGFSYIVDLVFTPMVTFTHQLQTSYNLILGFTPSITFTLDIFYKAYSGILYIVDLLFTPVVTFTEAFQTSYNIILAFTPSVTFTKIMQATYEVLLNFAPTVTFTLKAIGNYFVDFIFQPSVTFTLDILHDAFAGFHYYVDLIFTPIVDFTLDIIKAFPYGIRHVIGLAIISFVLAIIGICFAVTKKD